MIPTKRAPGVVQRGKACAHGLVGACLLALLVTAAGCGAPADDGPPELGPLPVIRTAADIRLPLDHYIGSWRDRITLETAREELVSRCMAAKGYPGYPVGDYSAHLLQPRTGNRFGVLDEREAAVHGFAPSWVPAFEQEGLDLAERFADWSGPDIDVALKGAAAAEPPTGGRSGGASGAGVPSGGESAEAEPGGEPNLTGERSGGCIGQSHRELFELGGSVSFDRSWVTLADEQAIVRAEDDPRMKPVVAAWASCMQRAGYSYRTPEEAAADERWQNHPPEERTVAVAVVRCTQSSRLLDTLIALATAYEERFIEENAERLAQERRFKDNALRAIAEQGLGKIGGSPGSPPPVR